MMFYVVCERSTNTCDTSINVICASCDSSINVVRSIIVIVVYMR